METIYNRKRIPARFINYLARFEFLERECLVLTEEETNLCKLRILRIIKENPSFFPENYLEKIEKNNREIVKSIKKEEQKLFYREVINNIILTESSVNEPTKENEVFMFGSDKNINEYQKIFDIAIYCGEYFGCKLNNRVNLFILPGNNTGVQISSYFENSESCFSILIFEKKENNAFIIVKEILRAMKIKLVGQNKNILEKKISKIFVTESKEDFLTEAYLCYLTLCIYSSVNFFEKGNITKEEWSKMFSNEANKIIKKLVVELSSYGYDLNSLKNAKINCTSQLKVLFCKVCLILSISPSLATKVQKRETYDLVINSFGQYLLYSLNNGLPKEKLI